MISKSKIEFYGTNSRGTKQGFYIEDIPNPLNTYAKNELMGEEFVKETMNKYLIFRTSWVLWKGKQNFLYKLTQWAENNDILRIAVDGFFSSKVNEDDNRCYNEGS